jgi:group I intron endonuclease
MEERFKNNHPMFDKTHSIKANELISKPRALNLMFGNSHSHNHSHTIEILEKLSNSKSKPVTLYNNNDQYILAFKNNIQLAKFLNCNKSTIGRYLKSGKCFKGLYYFKTN